MTHHAVRELRSVLEREREAIRRMDAQAVDECTAEKQRLFVVVTTATKAGEISHEEVKSLCIELRRNGVLLAFARDCVRDALGLETPKRAQPTRGVRLSVSG